MRRRPPVYVLPPSRRLAFGSDVLRRLLGCAVKRSRATYSRTKVWAMDPSSHGGRLLGIHGRDSQCLYLRRVGVQLARIEYDTPSPFRMHRQTSTPPLTPNRLLARIYERVWNHWMAVLLKHSPHLPNIGTCCSWHPSRFNGWVSSNFRPRCAKSPSESCPSPRFLHRVGRATGGFYMEVAA